MGFVQIIEMRTKSFDELQALGDEFVAASSKSGAEVTPWQR